jgi:hypothetical protein
VKSADRALPGGAAMASRRPGKIRLPPRRLAAPGHSDCPQPKPSVFLDATPMTNLRDAKIRNATGFLPHSTAPPAVYAASRAARLGVLPEWQSVCSSAPPTPKKLGWW